MATLVNIKTGEFLFQDTVEKVQAYLDLLARCGINTIPYLKMYEGDDAFAEV